MSDVADLDTVPQPLDVTLLLAQIREQQLRDWYDPYSDYDWEVE